MNLDLFKVKMKSLHKSFTNWFNAGGMIVLQSILTYPDLITYLKVHELFYIIIVGNIVIRVFKTSNAIEAK